MLKKSILILIVNFSFFCHLFAGDKLDLSLNLKVGDTYKISIPMQVPTNMDISMSKESIQQLLGFQDTILSQNDSFNIDTSTIEQFSQKIKLDMQLNIVFMVKVLEHNKNNYLFELYFDELSYYSKQDSTEVRFNTKSSSNKIPDKNRAEFNSLKKVIGQKFLVSTNQIGKILEIQHYDKIEKLLNVKKVEDSKSNNALSDQLKAKNFENTLSDIFNILPNKPVGIGDSWIKEFVIKDEVAPYIVKTKYTLKDIEEDALLINSMTIVYSEKPTANQFTTEGDGNAIIRLSKSDSFAQEQNYSLKLMMKMNLLGMDMLINSDASCVYSVKKVF